MNEISLR